MDPHPNGAEPLSTGPTSATAGNPGTPEVLKQPDSSPAPGAKPKKPRSPRPPRTPKAEKAGNDKARHWYLTARPSEKHGPMGHFHHLTADEAGPSLRSGILVEPTADQLKQRVDGPAE